MRRSFRIIGLFGIAILAAPADVGAQRVTDLAQGVRVQVVTNEPRPVIGKLESVTSDSIKVRTKVDLRAFALDSTKAVYLSTSPGRGRGMLRAGIPAGLIGGAFGAALSALTWEKCKPGHIVHCEYVPTTRARATMFGGAAIGAASFLVGSVVGAIKGSEVWTPVSVR